MAIIKTKIKVKNYMQIEKTGIEDGRLSWAATGLLTYLIGRPENWNIIIEHLKNIKTDGRDATRRALNNLREFNYCHYFEIRNRGRVVETLYLVFEIPTDPEEAVRHLELEDGFDFYYKKFTRDKKEDDVEELIENIEVLPETGNPFSVVRDTEEPKTEKPFPANSFPENPTLIIIEDNKDRINNNRTTTTNENSSEKNSSRYDFLDLKKFEKLNSATKSNIRKNIQNLTQEKAEEIYNLTEEFISKGKGKSFDAIFYSGVSGQWNFQVNDMSSKKCNSNNEIDQEKKSWLNSFAGIVMDKEIYESVKNIITTIPIEILKTNKNKLARMSMFEFKQHLMLLKKSYV